MEFSSGAQFTGSPGSPFSSECLYICSIDPCPTDAIVALSEDEDGENDEDGVRYEKEEEEE